jgi:hypothetical protein
MKHQGLANMSVIALLFVLTVVIELSTLLFERS